MPGVGLLEAEEHAQRRGLAGAVGAEEAGDRAGLDGEAEVGDGPDLAEGLGESADLDPDGVDRRGAVALEMVLSSSVGGLDRPIQAHRATVRQLRIRRAGAPRAIG